MYIYLFKMKYIAASDKGWVMMGNRVNIGGKWRWVSDEGRVMSDEGWVKRGKWRGLSGERWGVSHREWWEVRVCDKGWVMTLKISISYFAKSRKRKFLQPPSFRLLSTHCFSEVFSEAILLLFLDIRFLA